MGSVGDQKTITEQIKHAVDSETAQRQQAGGIEAPVGSADNPSDAIFTVANFITLCRFVLTFFFLLLFPRPHARGVALTCYIIAAITDFLDGQVARRTQTVSWVGKIMDPVMDRFLLFTGVIGLVAADELPFWIALVVITRDVVLAGGAVYLQQYERRPVDVIFIGKLATACLMFGFCDMLLGVPVVAGFDIAKVAWLPGLNGTPVAVGMFIIYLAIICSSHTAGIYTWIGYHIWENAKASTPLG